MRLNDWMVSLVTVPYYTELVRYCVHNVVVIPIYDTTGYIKPYVYSQCEIQQEERGSLKKRNEGPCGHLAPPCVFEQYCILVLHSMLR